MLTVLVAARGTGAVRVVDAAVDAGLRPVTVYEPGALRSLAPDLADEAYALSRRVGTAWPIEEILAAAAATGADIVHPGFTDPARDAALARAVEAAGLLWGGAPPALLAELADPAGVNGAGPGSEPGTEVGVDVAEDPATGRGAVRRLHALPAPRRRLSAVVARERGGPVRVLCVAEWSAGATAGADGPVQAAVVECPATGAGAGMAAAIDAFAQRLPGLGLAHGLATLDLDVTPDGTVGLAGVRAGLQPDHAAAEEALDVDLAALELELATGAARPSLPGAPVRHARCRVVRPAGRPTAARPDRIVELALPTGTGVRCDTGVRGGDLVPDRTEVLFVLTTSGSDARQAARRAERAAARLVVAGVPLASEQPWPTAATADRPGSAGAEPSDPAEDLLRSGAPQAVVDAALAEVAPGVRTLVLEVDHRRVRIAVHPRTRPPRPRPPRELRTGARTDGDLAVR